MAVQQFNVGVVDCKIAARSGVATYGTVYDVVAIDNFTITYTVANAELPGDGGIVDIFSRITKAEIKFKFGFQDMAVWAVLTGQTLSSTDSYDHISVDTKKMPYFGMMFETEHSDGNGNSLFFVPKLKIMSDISFEAGQIQFITNEITATAVRENTTYGVVGMRQANVAQSLAVMPPWN